MREYSDRLWQKYSGRDIGNSTEVNSDVGNSEEMDDPNSELMFPKRKRQHGRDDARLSGRYVCQWDSHNLTFDIRTPLRCS